MSGKDAQKLLNGMEPSNVVVHLCLGLRGLVREFGVQDFGCCCGFCGVGPKLRDIGVGVWVLAEVLGADTSV